MKRTIILKSLQKYPRGSRGSPAKGVVWENRSEGSNPSFCAKKRGYPTVSSFFGVRGALRNLGLSRVRAREQKEVKYEISTKLVTTDTLAEPISLLLRPKIHKKSFQYLTIRENCVTIRKKNHWGPAV